MKTSAIILFLMTSSLALAAPKQSYHCKTQSGAVDVKKGKKECLAAKGQWKKDTTVARHVAKAKTPAGKAQ